MKSLGDADQAMHDPDMAVLTFAQMTPGKTLLHTSTTNPRMSKDYRRFGDQRCNGTVYSTQNGNLLLGYP